MVEIILLALVALFVGLRLFSVLGRRTGHEQTVAKPAELSQQGASIARPVADIAPAAASGAEATVDSAANDGIRAIVGADPQFDTARFLEGAQAAYRMILEAYWKGDEAALNRLTGEDVRDAFLQAIADRKASGHILDNRLVTIERAAIERARLSGQTANVTVRFDADIAAITRDADGNVVAGSLTDAVPTHDVWTFSRNVRADDPNWVLIETDEAA
ncbi:MAG: Tim44 protein [Sphingomonas bacterium]|nr:Tim44/TimA family putative adaptor protein [Sphingomonas bacterium]MDB5688271.1 Tim44 protein [Sphingomonas bacterium]